MTLALLRVFVGRVPGWAWALVLSLSWGGWQHHRAAVAGRQAVAAEQALRQLQADAAKATKDALVKQIEVQQGAIHVAQETAAQDRAGADAAADALRRLRQRAAHACGGAAPAAAAGSQAATGGPVVSAELFSRLGEAAGRLAAIADERGRAGAACEAIAKGSP